MLLRLFSGDMVSEIQVLANHSILRESTMEVDLFIFSEVYYSNLILQSFQSNPITAIREGLKQFSKFQIDNLKDLVLVNDHLSNGML